jgi:hypothetical protein
VAARGQESTLARRGGSDANDAMGFRIAVLSCIALALAAGDADARVKAAGGDLTGVWTNTTATPIERPAALSGPTVDAAGEAAYLKAYRKANADADADVVGGGESEWWERGTALLRIGGRARSSMIVDPADGRLPWSPGGRATLAKGFAVSFDDPERRPLSEQCLGGTPSRPPMMPHRSNSLYRFVQTRDHLVIWVESAREPRIVRIGGSHPAARMRLWGGDSIGHWEGRTLVVETTNLNPGEAFKSPQALYISKDAKVTERFTRVSAGEIVYAFTVEDAAIYSQPWRAQLVLRAAKGPLFEYACHEGNYALPGILAGARHDEQAAREAPKGSAEK